MTPRAADISRRGFLASASAVTASLAATDARSADADEKTSQYAGIKAEFEEYGYVVLNNLIPRQDAAQVERRVKEIMSRRPDANETDQHLPGFLNHLDPKDDGLFLPLITQPICLKLAHDLLGDGFQMTEIGCRWRKPGAPEGPIHAGRPLEAFAKAGLPAPNICFVVGFSWILHDLTKEMGTSFNLPFSHHAPHGPRAGVRYKNLVPVEASAGSLLIYHGGLWHLFGANTTKDKARVGLMGGYYPFWMDPASVDWKPLKKSVRDRMPPVVQKMTKHVTEG